MPWHPDIPDLPLDKPKIIEDLEQMDPAIRNSMPPAEIDETIESIAYDVAEAYKEKFPNGTTEECLNFVSIALRVTGSALGGKIGLSMIASCDTTAETACRFFYEDTEKT